MLKIIKKYKLEITVAIIGIILLATGVCKIIDAESFKSKINAAIENKTNYLNTMSASDYSDAKVVYGEIYYVLDEYCEKSTANTVYGLKASSAISSKYYVIPCTGSDSYVSVVIKSKSNRAEFTELMNKTWSYFIDETAETDWEPYFFTGKVKRLDSSALPYLRSWFNETQWFEADEIDKHIIMYQLEEYSYDSSVKYGYAFAGAGVLLIAVCGIILLLKCKIRGGIVTVTNEQPEPTGCDSADNTAPPQPSAECPNQAEEELRPPASTEAADKANEAAKSSVDIM